MKILISGRSINISHFNLLKCQNQMGSSSSKPLPETNNSKLLPESKGLDTALVNTAPVNTICQFLLLKQIDGLLFSNLVRLDPSLQKYYVKNGCPTGRISNAKVPNKKKIPVNWLNQIRGDMLSFEKKQTDSK